MSWKEKRDRLRAQQTYQLPDDYSEDSLYLTESIQIAIYLHKEIRS